jgi:hypothetical protein
VMLRGCGSSGIVRGFFMATPWVAPPYLITAFLDRRATPFARFSWSFNFRRFQRVGRPSDLVNQSPLFPDSGRWFSDCAE